MNYPHPDQAIEDLIAVYEDRARRAKAQRPVTARSIGRAELAQQTVEALRELLEWRRRC